MEVVYTSFGINELRLFNKQTMEVMNPKNMRVLLDVDMETLVICQRKVRTNFLHADCWF